MPEARRILLVRLDGLGDALVCVPALEGLRRAFPHALFGAICSGANVRLFSRARMHAVYEREGSAADAQLKADLRSASYTDVLVATEEPIGYVFARASRACRRAGFWHRFEKTFKSLWQYAQLTDRVYRPAAWVEQPEHEVCALYRVAERLGAGGPIPDDPAQLRAWLSVETDARAHVGGDALALQVAPKLFSNGWSPQRVAAMARVALDASPLRRCVVLASSLDQELARSVLEHAGREAVESGRISLAPTADLPKWLGAIGSAGALLTPDTGAAHAAGILGVPVVDLFESERFAQLARQWRPWAAPSRCLAKPVYALGADSALGSSVGAALTELVRSSGVAS